MVSALVRAVRHHTGRRVTRAAHRLSRVERGIDPTRGAVALTFDDGPDPRFTPLVLDALAEYDARATFFLVGHRAEAHQALVRRIAAAGHVIGSHTYSHPDPWTLSFRALLREYRAGRQAVEDVLDAPAPLFRPPKGHLDRKGALAMRAAGLHPWLWTADTDDWRPGVSAEVVADAVLPLKAGDVVLLHDSIEGAVAPQALDRSATVAATELICRDVKASGLCFATLPERGPRPPGQRERTKA